MTNPDIPSTPDLTIPSMIGLVCNFFFAEIGSQSISLIELLIENLNTWSENFAIKTVNNVPLNKKPSDPIAKLIGKISSPLRIPNLFKMNPVIDNCIKRVANPVSP